MNKLKLMNYTLNCFRLKKELNNVVFDALILLC